MHHSNLVLIELIDDLDTAVWKAMEHGQNVWWDFYHIGGRWTGLLDGYDPLSDPDNTEKCEFCDETGKCPELERVLGTDKCPDPDCVNGRKPKWPIGWKRHSGDVIPVERLTEEQLAKFDAVVVDVRYKDDLGENFPTLDWLKSTHKGFFAVVVDNHDYVGPLPGDEQYELVDDEQESGLQD